MVGKSTSQDAMAVWITGADGNPIYPGGTSGPQPSASSQSVTPASDSAPFPIQARDMVPIATTPVTANGTNLFSVDATGFNSIAAQLTIPTGTTVIFQGSDDNVVWDTVRPTDSYDGAYTGGVTFTGLYSIPATHRYIRARTSAYTSGTVTAVAYLRALFVPSGSQGVTLRLANGTPLQLTGTNVDAFPTNVFMLNAQSFGMVFNGATWDRARGDTTGAYVVGKGGANIVTTQVAVAANTATLVAAARAGRQKITVSPTTSVAFYQGPAGVTNTTGLFVPAGGSKTTDTAAALYVYSTTAIIVSVEELY